MLSAVIAGFSAGSSSLLSGRFERIGLPVMRGLLGVSGLFVGIFVGRGTAGFIGVVGLSTGFMGVVGSGLFIGVLTTGAANEGVASGEEEGIFASQSSESSSAKKLSDIEKKKGNKV